MTGDPRMFTSLNEDVDDQERITFDDNSKGKVQGLGKVAISNDHLISNVLYVASLSFNLLSIGQLCDLGFQCLFTKKEVVVSMKDDDQVIFKGFRYNNLYLVDFTSKDANLKTCLFTKTSLGWLWHRRLTHVGMSSLKKLMKKELVRGLKDVKFEKDKLCSTCQDGKTSCKHSSYKSFHVNHKSARTPSHGLIWTNNIQEFGRKSLLSYIVDDYSRYTWVFFLHDKSEVASCFKKFAKRAQNKFESEAQED